VSVSECIEEMNLRIDETTCLVNDSKISASPAGISSMVHNRCTNNRQSHDIRCRRIYLTAAALMMFFVAVSVGILNQNQLVQSDNGSDLDLHLFRSFWWKLFPKKMKKDRKQANSSPAPLLSKKGPHHTPTSNECQEDLNYSTHTAKTAYEVPFAALFADTKSQKKFEASSITTFGGNYYAICDNSWAISKFSPSLTPFSSDNIMIGDPRREEEDSGYEAIFFRDQVAYVVRESVAHRHDSNTTYHAIIEELSIDGDDYTILNQCRSEYEFEGDSKGFEGAFGLEGKDGDYYILGLCEGNHCSEKSDLKFDKGNGRIIVMKKSILSSGESEDESNCIWTTHSIIKIPNSANFRDYSDISITSNGRVVITTQEDSAMWFGQLLGVHDGIFDPETAAFDENIGQVYNFPKSDSCKTVYCNIEGITFINENMVMAVSDQMKKKGKQDYYCLDKDQSIHAFVLP